MTERTFIVFLAGMLCDDTLWARQAHDLYQLADSRIHILTEDETIEAMAERVLDASPARFVLCGLSLGGYVAMEIMRRAPERVERLVLADTSARADSMEQRRRRKGLIELAALGKFKGVTPRLLPTILSQRSLETPEITGIVMAMAQHVGRDAYVRQQTAIIARQDSRDSLKKISCPVLVLVGAEDRVTPLEMASEMVALIPHSTLQIVEFAGHLPPLEQSDAVTHSIKLFIKK